MLFAWLRNRRGVEGLLAGAALWALSAGALTLSMRANLAASVEAHAHQFGGAEVLIRHLHAAAVLWSLGFTVLQVTSLVMFAFVLRACYRLRSAVCFAVGAAFVILGDLLGLLGLLIWVGMTQDVG